MTDGGGLTPLAASVDLEEQNKKHLIMTIDHWLVESHSLMPTEISERINAAVEDVQNISLLAGAAGVEERRGGCVPAVAGQ